jgi:hypothetical protein
MLVSRRLGIRISAAAIFSMRFCELRNACICLREILKNAVSEPEKKAEHNNKINITTSRQIF